MLCCLHMVTPELLEYIRSTRQSGSSVDQMRTALLQTGWNANDIENAFQGNITPASSPESPVRSHSGGRRAMLLGATVVIVIGIGGWLAYAFLLPRFRQPAPVNAPAADTSEPNMQDQTAMAPVDSSGANDKTTKLFTIPSTIDAQDLPDILLSINPEGRAVSYSFLDGKNSFVMVNDVKYGPYDSALPAVLNSDGTKNYILARRGDKKFIVLNGKELTQFQDINIEQIQFSPDGKHFAYAGVMLQQIGDLLSETVVLDGIPQTTYVGIDDMQFSRDSQHLAYIAIKGSEPKNWTSEIVVDGKVVVEYPYISNFSLKFTDDFTTMMFAASGSNGYDGIHNQEFVVIGGSREKTYDAIQPVTAAPDFSRYAYFARKDTTDEDSVWYVVVDATEYEPYKDVEGLDYQPAISPDGKHIGFAAETTEGKGIVWVDGTEASIPAPENTSGLGFSYPPTFG